MDKPQATAKPIFVEQSKEIGLPAASSATFIVGEGTAHGLAPISECNALLINPSVNRRTQTPILKKIIRSMFPTGLGYIAGYLHKKQICKCYIVDEMLDDIDDATLARLVNAMPKPRVIGLGVVTASVGPAFDIGRRVMQIDPEALVVMGGIHVTVLPHEALEYKAAHIVVRGEGEEIFADFMETLLAGGDWHAHAGLSWIDESGVIHDNPDRALVKDLDELPPFPFHLFAHNRHRYTVGFYSILSSRGCPYKCTFCSTRSMTALSYRYHSEERVVEEIETLVNLYGAQSIFLIDDNFAVNKKRLNRLCDAIIAKGLHKKVSFEGSMRADNADPSIFAKLRETNFQVLSYGLETGSERLMTMIKKGETVQQVIDGIKLADSYGFKVCTTIIFGFPTETAQDRWDAIKMVYALPLDSVRFNILTPYPGTPLFDQIKAEGTCRIAPEWANFSVQYMWKGSDLPYIPEGTNSYILMFTTMFANLAYYLRPSGIKRMLTSKVAGGNVIILPKGWIASGYAFSVARIAIYLLRRFCVVAVMAALTAPFTLLGRLIKGKKIPFPAE